MKQNITFDNQQQDISFDNNFQDYSRKSFDVIYNVLLDNTKKNPELLKQAEHTNEENRKGGVEGFFTFQLFLSSQLIQILYILGAVSLTITCWVLFIKTEFIIGLLSIIVGNILWRLCCEIAVVFFRIHDRLDLIHRKL